MAHPPDYPAQRHSTERSHPQKRRTQSAPDVSYQQPSDPAGCGDLLKHPDRPRQTPEKKATFRGCEKLVKRAGTSTLTSSNRSRELKLDLYHVITDNKSLRIIAQDGRGEILNYPRYAASSHPEVEAKVSFTTEDAEFFRTIVERLEERDRQAL